MIGCAIGAPLGLLFGGIVGQLPIIIGLKLISRRFDRMTTNELVAELHDSHCMTPNLLLLELDRRGYDIQVELPFVPSFFWVLFCPSTKRSSSP